MHVAIILGSLAIVLSVYVFLSKREGNYVNVLTPFMVLSLPAYYFLELAYGAIFGYEGTESAYAICYAAYTLGVVGLTIGYLGTPQKVLPIFLRLPNLRIPALPFILLLCAGLLYAPILIRFSDLILSPRRIYELTRTGFGIQFYLSTFLVYFAFILLLFSRSRGWLSLGAFSLVALAILYLHGSKAQVLFFFLIALYFLVFVRGWRFGFRRLLGLGLTASVVILTLFYVTFSESLREDFFLSITRYSDETRNAVMAIDDASLDHQFGRLTLESKLYAFIPRAVFPDKPKDFGPFWLAKRYYPDWFEADKGMPAFGFGVLYADFGIFAIFYHVFGLFLTGIALKVLISRLKERPDAGSFLLLLVLMKIPLIPLGGADFPIIVYYVLALAANALSRNEILLGGMGGIIGVDALRLREARL